ncbi:MAG TPA: hypothetical protein VNO30_27580 [Kofleriaceae bacterium]|nr:hypothetical protein [Kofleriaceae bacterium]
MVKPARLGYARQAPVVAVQAFVDAAGSRSTEARLRRAQLRVMSPALESHDTFPEHLQKVVGGIFQEIDGRVFHPIQSAPNLDEALGRARAGFEIFVVLWQAVLRALGPWLQENPERLATLGHRTADVWASDPSGHLDDEARAWFAAAQDARVALADAIMHEPTIPPASEEKIVRHCLVADFALLFGLFLAHEAPTASRSALPVVIGKLAYDAAKAAYVLATTPRFEDPVPSGHE